MVQSIHVVGPGVAASHGWSNIPVPLARDHRHEANRSAVEASLAGTQRPRQEEHLGTSPSDWDSIRAQTPRPECFGWEVIQLLVKS